MCSRWKPSTPGARMGSEGDPTRGSSASRTAFQLLFAVDILFTVVVNKAIRVHLGSELEAEAIRVLRSIPEIAVTTELELGHQADAVIHSPGMRTPVAVETKARVNGANVHHLIRRAQQVSLPMVVIAREMTDAARELLTAEGIGTFDGLGNVRLALPGLLIRIDGEARPQRARTPSRLSGKAGLVAQALLLDPARAWHITDLSAQAGVSPALAYRVLERLTNDGILTSQGAGPTKTRQLAEPAALLDLWVEEHHEQRLRRPAFILVPAAEEAAVAICDGLAAIGVDYALTGAAAAVRIAPFVTSVPVTDVWIGAAADPEATCELIGAQAVDSGPNVVLMQGRDEAPLVFRAQTHGLWSVNVFRLYLDLRQDPRRGREQADHLRSEVIGF